MWLAIVLRCQGLSKVRCSGEGLVLHGVWQVLESAKDLIDVSYSAPQAHRIVNVVLHREYSPGIVFIFSQERKYLYHV
jgi:hypothetical protein